MDNSAKSVGVMKLACIECGRRWTDRSERWRAYLTDDDPPRVIVYCELCAEREFGG
jgi:hypothetical protein